MDVAVPEDSSGYDDGGGGNPARVPLILAAVIALAGAGFSGQSTYDFMQHLDRQVHSIHCSFIPGAAAELGESGCRTVMLSPYSSFFRGSLWGGIPVALWSLAVFAFLAFRAGTLAMRKEVRKRDTLFLLAAFGLPVLMSAIYAFLSISKLDTTCKVCVGIYASSLLGIGAAVFAHLKASPDPQDGVSPGGLWGGLFAQGVGYVGVLTLVYLAFMPSGATARARSCGSLVQGDDPARIMLPLGGKGTKAIEVLDPLCPSCRAFSDRLHTSGFEEKLELRGVLFPLDSSCNWMVTDSLHPGACAVSEALLCVGPLSKNDAGKQEKDVARLLTWAFKNQEELRTQARADEKAFRERLEREIPAVKGCLGGSLVKNKLVKSLRWGVANAIPVLTPQLFVGKTRICDEDTDMGLEYSLGEVLAGRYHVAEAMPKGGRR